jgi:hypothetical protein
VAFVTIIHQNWPHLAFKKLKVLGIGMNKIHTKHTASGKCFGQKFQRQKSDATSLTQTSTKQSQDADFVKEKKGGL